MQRDSGGRAGKRINRIKAGLKEQILALPDNPNITRLGESGKCFAMSSSKLGGNWSPEYHDFREQYQILINLIDAVDAVNLPAELAKIIATGKVRAKFAGRGRVDTVTFNPQVIEHLAGII